MSKNAGRAVVCVMGGLLTGLIASGQSLPSLYPFPNASANRPERALLSISRDERAQLFHLSPSRSRLGDFRGRGEDPL